MLREIVSAVFILTISVWGSPTCRTLFNAEVVCVAGSDDYILQRGLVSDNNDTVAITLKDCRITDVDIEAFKNVYNLEEIDLSRNKISSLKVGVFDGIPKVSSLTLSKNLLSTLPLGLFDNLPKLQRLDLGGNKIKFLQLGIFNYLPQLVRLDLAKNEFLGKELDPCLFNRNPKIKYLYFSGNNMSEAPDQLLNGFQNLKFLGLNKCHLTEIPKFVTGSNLITLKKLFLQTNQIRLDDPKTFINMENLVELDLFHNVIENLNETVFKPLTKLKIIDLSFNKIKQLPQNMFQNMLHIRIIFLSNNLIKNISSNAFQSSSLQILDLSGNRISYLEKNFVSKLYAFNKTLSSFDFRGNPFQCACLVEILNDVKKLGIEHDIDEDIEDIKCSMTNKFTCLRPDEELRDVDNH
uniref:Leureptin n=2 Tax=Manduca sexta TaxID=7130 RepID=Q0VJU4_MANSE|nr:leureptin [Manduca sexta]